jgi:hypothetical protein
MQAELAAHDWSIRLTSVHWTRGLCAKRTGGRGKSSSSRLPAYRPVRERKACSHDVRTTANEAGEG